MIRPGCQESRLLSTVGFGMDTGTSHISEEPRTVWILYCTVGVMNGSWMLSRRSKSASNACVYLAKLLQDCSMWLNL